MIPLMLDLHASRVLVFGAGTVGKRKAAYFADSDVTFVSKPETDVSVLSDGELKNLISSRDIIIAALPDAGLNEKICRIAQDCGKLFNSATGCGSFLIPATWSEGDVTIAVSTNGKAPALAAALRNDIASRYPNLAEDAREQDALRKQLKKSEPDEKKRREEIRSALPQPKEAGLCIALASFDYTNHDQTALTQARFDEAAFFAAEPFDGAVLIQTCNRVEILVHGSKEALAAFLEKHDRTGFIFFEDAEALLHLSKLAAGIESLIIGEDQILGQMKDAFLKAEAAGVSDSITKTCINTAISLGVRVRQETAINRGAVSIGSAAVKLAGEICGDLSGKNILVVGGGEMGRLVTKSLAEKNLRAIYVTNRTYENAQKLACEVNGRAMHLDQLYPCIGLSDVVISCTAAPHEIIRARPLAEVMESRFWPLDDGPRPLVLIDIAQPCDVEKSCAELPGVRLFHD
jgi:glutamyl-tRNA reductase